MADNEPIDLEAARVRRELLRRLEREDWGTIIKKLTRYAQKRIGRRPFGQDAEDLAQSAQNCHRTSPTRSSDRNHERISQFRP